MLIHHTQYIDRAEAIFATGLIHITLLFAYPSNTRRSQQWRNRLRQLHILPHTYHYHNFLSSNSVYIKLHFNPDQPPTLLPSTWPLLCWLHSHWHSPPRTQSPCQTQATPEQHPHLCRTLLTLLALTQQHPSLHYHSTYLP